MAKKKPLSGAEFVRKMAAAKARKAAGVSKNIKKFGEAAGGVFGLKLAKKKRKNAGAGSVRKTKKLLKEKGHKVKAKSAAGKQLARLYRANKGKEARRNPEESAAERFEFFHGPGAAGAGVVTDVTETVYEHSVLSGIGKLKALVILAVDGRTVVTLEGFQGALLAQDEKGTQLYIKGGNQKVDLKEFGIDGRRAHNSEVLGACEEVVYLTDKTHLRPEDGGKADYHHKFGKKGSRLPIMIYDVRNQRIEFSGGGYDLPEVGIRG